MVTADTMIGIVIGVVSSILISHYYYRRSVRKSIGAYEVLSTQLFDGIDRDVREQFEFKYRDVEVADVQQVQFIIANDGELAISGVIKPLRLQLPIGVKVLDASILHRRPDVLTAEVEAGQDEGGPYIEILFPLLNKREFVFVSLLLSGRVGSKDAKFSIVADDLPRSFGMRRISPSALDDPKEGRSWVGVVLAMAYVASLAWFAFVIVLLAKSRPDLFPYPWRTFSLSFEAMVVTLPGAVFVLIGLVVLIAIVALGADGLLKRTPRFTVPVRFHPSLMSQYGRKRLGVAFGDDNDESTRED